MLMQYHPTQTPSRYGHMAKVGRPLSMGTWQYAEGREKKAKKAAADRRRTGGLCVGVECHGRCTADSTPGCPFLVSVLSLAFRRRNARDKTETKKGHPGVESAVQRPWHSTPTHKPPVRRRSAAAFFAFFSLPSAYCHVPILSGLPTLAMCPYRLGVWVAPSKSKT